MSNDPVDVRMQRMKIRGVILLVAMLILLALAFFEDEVNGEIVRIFEGITIAGAVFFFPDSVSLFGWFRNVKISRNSTQ